MSFKPVDFDETVPQDDEQLIAQGEKGSPSVPGYQVTSPFDQIVRAVEQIIEAIGEDPGREGLVDTPKRVARFWLDFKNYQAGDIEVTFEAIETDQMVIVRNINGWSLCEHHLLPFSFTAHVGYITNKKVIGLSKIPRIVQKHAHRLQLQERLANDAAEELMSITGALGVGVLIEGQHTCMQMRGVRSNGSMISSSLKGVFLANPSAKQEFMSLAMPFYRGY